METIIDEAKKRAYRYWTEDGLPELFIGAGFVSYALLLWWSIKQASGVGIMCNTLFLPVWILPGTWIIQKVKERVTYPRTGYVTYQPMSQHKKKTLLAGVLAAMVLVAIVFFSDASALLFTILFVLILGWITWQQKCLRFAFYTLLALATGLFVFFNPTIFSAGGGQAAFVDINIPVLLITGAAMLAGGGITLVRFLRTHPPAGDLS